VWIYVWEDQPLDSFALTLNNLTLKLQRFSAMPLILKFGWEFDSDCVFKY